MEGSGSGQVATTDSVSGSSTNSSEAPRSSGSVWFARKPPKSFVARCPEGRMTKLLYGRWRGSRMVASTSSVALRRWAWRPNTT
jgi:hypothetical protein